MGNLDAAIPSFSPNSRIVKGYRVTSQRDQIQALIAEIDSVLQRGNPRLPLVMAGDVAQQRQVLERVRNFLVQLYQYLSVNESARLGGVPTPAGTPLFTQDVYPPASSPAQPGDSPAGEVVGERTSQQATQQMMQRLLQEISYLRANLSQSAAGQPPITPELLQLLMTRLQEGLSQQITQALGNLPNQPPAAGAAPPQYEQLQQLRDRSDQMLMNLDATLNIVFESLQRNIQSYENSLSQGLERMHNLGQQGEAALKGLLDQLALQLKQEAAAYFRSTQLPQAESPQPDAIAPTTAALTPPPLTTAAPTSPIIPPPPIAQPPAHNFPYAGAELLSADISEADVTSPPSQPSAAPAIPLTPGTILDDAIEAWLRFAAVTPDTTGTILPADQPTLDLSALVGEPIEAAGPVNLTLASPDQSLGQQPGPPAHTLDLGSESSPASADIDQDTADINAALQLLEELSAEWENSATPLSLEDAEAQLNQFMGTVTLPELPLSLPEDGSTSSSPELPEDARIELDEFYQSMFGQESPPPPAAEETLPPPPLPDHQESLQAAVEPLPSPPDLPPPPLPGEAETPSPAADRSTEPSPELPDAPSPEAIAPVFELPDNLFEQPASPVVPPSPGTPLLESDQLEIDQIGSLTDLFSDVRAEEGRSIPTEPPGVPSWKTHQSPIAPAAPTGSGVDQLSEVGFTADAGDDQYARAAPDENLLPDAPLKDVSLALELNETTLTSLNEDLSTLEGNLEPDGASYADSVVISPTGDRASFDPTLSEAPTQIPIPAELSEAPSEAPADSSPQAQKPAPTISQPPSIHGLGALFANPPQTTVIPSAVPPPMINSQPISLIPPGDSPSKVVPPIPQPTEPLAESPAAGLPAAEPLIESPAEPITGLPAAEPITDSPFTLENPGELFDAAPPIQAELSLETPLPFTLEGLNDASVPAGHGNSGRGNGVKEIPPFKPDSSVSLEGTNKRSLDAAVESILGISPAELSIPDPASPSSQAAEKKK